MNTPSTSNLHFADGTTAVDEPRAIAESSGTQGGDLRSFAYRPLGDSSSGVNVTARGLRRLIARRWIQPEHYECREVGSERWVPLETVFRLSSSPATPVLRIEAATTAERGRDRSARIACAIVGIGVIVTLSWATREKVSSTPPPTAAGAAASKAPAVHASAVSESGVPVEATVRVRSIEPSDEPAMRTSGLSRNPRTSDRPTAPARPSEPGRPDPAQAPAPTPDDVIAAPEGTDVEPQDDQEIQVEESPDEPRGAREALDEFELPLAPGPSTCAAVGDLDGDGDIDILVGQEDLPLTALINDGRGGFTVREFPAPEGRVRAVALLDVDSDGDLDAMIGGVDARIRLWRNDGGQGFTDVSYELPWGTMDVTAIAIGDVDGDGDQDAVLGAGVGRSMFFRNVAARFVAERDSLPADLRSVTALALADLDGDGDLDLVFGQSRRTDGKGGRNRAARNDGSGRFTDATHAWMPSATDCTTAIVLADIDGDSRVDLICANRGSRSGERMRSAVHRASGEKFLGSRSKPFADHPALSRAVAAGDIDDDGDLDLVFGNDGLETLFLNDSTGVFMPVPGFGTSHDDTRAIFLIDVNGDHRLDVVTINHGGPIRCVLNRGAVAGSRHAPR